MRQNIFSLKKIILSALGMLLVACSQTPTATPENKPLIITVFATASTQSWLTDTYTCAESLHYILSSVNDPAQAEISIRIGEPAQVNTPAFQIGQEDLLIVTHRESPLQNLTLEDAQKLFSNPEPEIIQVWAYGPGEDIEEVFAQEVMNGRTVTSLARLAASPQQMSDSINQDKNTVGFLPRHWKAGTVRDIFTLPKIPVLAIVKTEPQGAIKDILACLQK